MHQVVPVRPKAAGLDPRTGGGAAAELIPEMRGTRGSLPEGTSQPDDPGGVGGLHFRHWRRKSSS